MFIKAKIKMIISGHKTRSQIVGKVFQQKKIVGKLITRMYLDK